MRSVLLIVLFLGENIGSIEIIVVILKGVHLFIVFELRLENVNFLFEGLSVIRVKG